MTVRLTPRGAPSRTDTYSGIARVSSDGRRLTLQGDPRSGADGDTRFPLGAIAEIALDEDGGSIE